MIQHSGIGVRIQNILRFMKESNEIDLYLFGDPQIIAKFSFPKGATVVPYYVDIYSIFEWFGHSKMREMDYLDIPHFNVPLVHISKCIVTIHDLIPWVMKEFHSSLAKRFYLKVVLNSICKWALRIITVSNYTKSDYIKYIGLPKHPIETIYNGINHNLYFPQSAHKIKNFKKKFNLPDSYFLSVGIGKGHKNFDFMIRNLIDLWRNNSIMQNLVLAGAFEFQIELLKNLPKEFREKVISLPKINDEDMPAMYQAAEALIYPSLYEGFGFPVVEAQSVACPVLSSNASVLPEILNTSAIFFDAKSDEEFKKRIIDFNNISQASKKKIIEKGIQNAKRFSWDSAVRRIQNLYQSLN